MATRNIPLYRDRAVILIDQLKKVHVEAELDVIDTGVWFAKVARGDYTVGLNLTAKRRSLVWNVEKTLARNVARPIITQNIAGLCWQPHVKNFVLHHNGIYNNWRFDDLWLDK